MMDAPLILGAGPAGCAAAIVLAKGGAQPMLLDRDEAVGDPLCGGFLSWRTLEQLQALGELTVEDYRGRRRVSVGQPGDNLQLTDDLATAVAHAQLLVVPLPATSHEGLAPQLAPLLSNGQVVFLPPGTFGGYLFAQAMQAVGNHSELVQLGRRAA